MPVPTQPTETLIATEALKMAGINSPTSAQVTRASDYGIQKVKDDLMKAGLEWSFLRKTGYLYTTANWSKVQLPTDFSKLVSVKLLDGTRRGTMQAATSTTITLAAADGGTAGDTEGHWIVVTSGTGGNQARQCTSYNATTKVATFSEAFSTTPDGTETYLVVDTEHPLHDLTIFDDKRIQINNVPTQPSAYFHQADEAEGDLLFENPCDAIYGVKVRYYADLRKIDSDATLYNRILRLLQWTFILGVYEWWLQNDQRKPVAIQEYQNKLGNAAAEFLYDNNEPGQQTTLDVD